MNSFSIFDVSHTDDISRMTPAAQTVWVLADAADPLATLGVDIDPYGYDVLRFDPGGKAVSAPGAGGAAFIVIGSLSQGMSVSLCVRAAAALPGRPAVLVIDQGLSTIDRILALEEGADDCIAWPCPPRELVARMRAISRRRRLPEKPADAGGDWEDASVVSFAGWTLNRPQRRLMRPGQTQQILSAAEFSVLETLLRNPRRVISRETLLAATAPAIEADKRHVRAVDIQVSRLRRRLEIDGEEVIRTVRGRGYMVLSPVMAL